MRVRETRMTPEAIRIQDQSFLDAAQVDQQHIENGQNFAGSRCSISLESLKRGIH
jgi:hypothetical protein